MIEAFEQGHAGQAHVMRGTDSTSQNEAATSVTANVTTTAADDDGDDDDDINEDDALAQVVDLDDPHALEKQLGLGMDLSLVGLSEPWGIHKKRSVLGTARFRKAPSVVATPIDAANFDPEQAVCDQVIR